MPVAQVLEKDLEKPDDLGGELVHNVVVLMNLKQHVQDFFKGLQIFTTVLVGFHGTMIQDGIF
jgi:hypothetical protein